MKEKKQTTPPKIHRTPPPLEAHYLDEEEQILCGPCTDRSG